MAEKRDSIITEEKKQKNRKILKICAAAFCAAAVVVMVIVSGMKSGDTAEYTQNTTIMGTGASITVYGRDGGRMVSEIMRIEDEFDTGVISWRADTSEVWKLNNTYEAGVDYPVSSELADIMTQTIDISKSCGSLLDVTIRPLAETWGIESGKKDIPSQDDIDEALSHVDVSKVKIHRNAEKKGNQEYINIDDSGMSIDLGAVGKGAGCDKAAEYLQKSTATGATIALGGSILVYGSKPDESEWRIGVRDPRGGRGTSMGVIRVKGRDMTFVSTSGDYEKYFDKDGKRYHHILNPRTGYPAWKHTIGATVVCDNGLLSDALSTLCMLLDRESAMDAVRRHGAECIIIDDQRNVYVSDGLRDSFDLLGEDYNIVE